MGILDWIGERLDTPLQGVGIDTNRLSDAEKWGMRGRVISAFGNSIGTNPQSFYGQLDNMAGAYAEQQEQLRKEQQAQEMQRQLAQVGQAGGNKGDVYRQYAAMFAARGQPELAKKYMDIAAAFDPKEEEYGQPVAVTGADGKPTLAQFSKTGAMRPVAGVAPAADLTSSIKDYQFAVQNDGYKGSFNQFILDQKKAGAGGTTVNIDPNKSLGNTLGVGVGDNINNTFTGAQAAQGTLGSVRTIRESLGNAITGPFADQRAFLARLQSGLGVAAGDTPERLADTRRVIQGLAKAELAAAAQMKGQGQITEAERAILKNAEAGTINLLPSEIKAVVDAMESSARKRIAAHQSNVQRLRKVPGAEGIIPFYELQDEEPPPARPGAGGAGSIQDAARRELQRRQQGGR
jgi:hypothetical protein